MIVFPSLELILLLLATTGSGKDTDALYAAIKNGDHDAFRDFFDAHYEALFSFLRSRKVSPDVADDLIQKAFIYIWEKRAEIKPERSLRAYLFRIAYTRMINHFKANKKFVDEEPITQAGENPATDIEYNELRTALDAAIEAMPEKRKMVFESCFMQEFTYKETAEILDVSVKTVENHMALALKDVRLALKKFKEPKKN